MASKVLILFFASLLSLSNAAIVIPINSLTMFQLLDVKKKNWMIWKYFTLGSICQNTTRDVLTVQRIFLF